MTHWRFLFMPLVLSLLAACVVPGREDPPEPDVSWPDTWSAEAGSEPLAEDVFWAAFEDEGLASAVEEALLRNRDLEAALHRVFAAEAESRIAGADRYPSAGVGASRTRNRQILVGFPLSGGGSGVKSTFTSYGVSLDLSWEIDLWGRLAAQASAAGSDLLATAADYAAARQSIAAQTVKGWLAWQEARLQEELALRSADAFRRNRDVVRRRYLAGSASALDARLAESDLAAALALREVRLEQATRAQRSLEALMGRYPSGALDAEARLPEVPALVPAGIPGDLLLRRPDLIASQERLLAADHRLHASRAALFPTISLTASAGRVSQDVEDLLDDGFSVWSLLAGLTQPIFQGGRLRAGVDLSDARLAESVALYEADLLRAFSEVETTLAVERILAAREEHLRVSSEAARAASDQASERYVSGLEDLLLVLESERRALVAESARLEARRARLEARVDLHLALGGGFGRVDWEDLAEREDDEEHAPSPGPAAGGSH